MDQSPESEPLEIPLPAPAGPAPKRGRGRPPKSATTSDPKPAPSPGPGRKSTKELRANKVASIYRQMGDALALAGIAVGPNAIDAGMAMSEHADKLGQAWADWAETSSRVARLIDGLSFGGGAVAVLLAHAPIAKALMSSQPSKEATSGGSLFDFLRVVPDAPAAV